MKNELRISDITSIQELQTPALHLHLKDLVKDERRIGVEILEALREIEVRRAHCELGYSSLFSYCVKELGYSESQAYRRVEAMRALKDVPELKEKIESGVLTVTTVSMIQLAAKKAPMSAEDKKALFQKMEGKPASEVESALKSQDAPRMHWLEITDEAKALLSRVKEVSAARFRDLNPSSSELILLLANEWLSKNDPLLLAEKKAEERGSENKEAVTESNPEPISTSSRKKDCVKHTRYIPAAINRKVWLRDRGQCTFVSPINGRRCESRYALQRDHIVLFSRGGSSRNAENLRLFCSAHNRARVPRVERGLPPIRRP